MLTEHGSSSIFSHMKTSFIDITGRRFGRWTVIKHTPRDEGEKPGQSRWQCRCKCGTIKDKVQYGGLVSGASLSCGCLRRELRVKPTSIVHSQRNPVYAIWMSMKTRCYNTKHPTFKLYGQRGISVCQRWLDSFDIFAEDMGPRPSPDHSVERKNNNGHYTPMNCVWATRDEQNSNKRSNRRIEWKGETRTLTQITRMEDVGYVEVHRQVFKLGKTIDEAVSFVRAAGHRFIERAIGMGGSKKNKTGMKRTRRVIKGRFIHLLPDAVRPLDPLADIW